jgi:multisubunit Na+/H+ antiporter MnhC subunit
MRALVIGFALLCIFVFATAYAYRHGDEFTARFDSLVTEFFIE